MVKRDFVPRRDGDPAAGEMLRSRRRQAGLSIAQAAARVPCSAGMWSMLENAQRRPSTVMAGAIADVLGLDGADLERLMAAALPGVGLDSPYKLAKELGYRPARAARRVPTPHHPGA